MTRRSKMVSDNGGGGSDFTPHPSGQFPVTCVDVVEVGYRNTQYGPKHKYCLYFWAGQWTTYQKDGVEHRTPMLIRAEFTSTLSERGKLRPFLEQWREKPFTKEELEGFDIEVLWGAAAYVTVVHRPYKGEVYANIGTIMRMPAGFTAPGHPEGFVRMEDRPDWDGPIPHPNMSQGDGSVGPGAAPQPEPEPSSGWKEESCTSAS